MIVLSRVRQGSIGSSWRHIKEVLGNTGNRVCFVDGMHSESSKFAFARYKNIIAK